MATGACCPRRYRYVGEHDPSKASNHLLTSCKIIRLKKSLHPSMKAARLYIGNGAAHVMVQVALFACDNDL